MRRPLLLVVVVLGSALARPPPSPTSSGDQLESFHFYAGPRHVISIADDVLHYEGTTMRDRPLTPPLSAYIRRPAQKPVFYLTPVFSRTVPPAYDVWLHHWIRRARHDPPQCETIAAVLVQMAKRGHAGRLVPVVRTFVVGVPWHDHPSLIRALCQLHRHLLLGTDFAIAVLTSMHNRVLLLPSTVQPLVTSILRHLNLDDLESVLGSLPVASTAYYAAVEAVGLLSPSALVQLQRRLSTRLTRSDWARLFLAAPVSERSLAEGQSWAAASRALQLERDVIKVEGGSWRTLLQYLYDRTQPAPATWTDPAPAPSDLVTSVIDHCPDVMLLGLLVDLGKYVHDVAPPWMPVRVTGLTEDFGDMQRMLLPDVVLSLGRGLMGCVSPVSCLEMLRLMGRIGLYDAVRRLGLRPHVWLVNSFLDENVPDDYPVEACRRLLRADSTQLDATVARNLFVLALDLLAQTLPSMEAANRASLIKLALGHRLSMEMMLFCSTQLSALFDALMDVASRTKVLVRMLARPRRRTLFGRDFAETDAAHAAEIDGRRPLRAYLAAMHFLARPRLTSENVVVMVDRLVRRMTPVERRSAYRRLVAMDLRSTANLALRRYLVEIYTEIVPDRNLALDAILRMDVSDLACYIGTGYPSTDDHEIWLLLSATWFHLLSASSERLLTDVLERLDQTQLLALARLMFQPAASLPRTAALDAADDVWNRAFAFIVERLSDSDTPFSLLSAADITTDVVGVFKRRLANWLQWRRPNPESDPAWLKATLLDVVSYWRQDLVDDPEALRESLPLALLSFDDFAAYLEALRQAPNRIDLVREMAAHFRRHPDHIDAVVGLLATLPKTSLLAFRRFVPAQVWARFVQGFVARHETMVLGPPSNEDPEEPDDDEEEEELDDDRDGPVDGSKWECMICFKVYSRKKTQIVLHANHPSICESCLEQTMEHDPRIGAYPCPFCRQPYIYTGAYVNDVSSVNGPQAMLTRIS